jgi:GAF domain-containing protein
VVAYAGVPLIGEDGQALGALCVIDDRPRHWTPDQVRLLADLAASVVTEIRMAASRAA